MYSWSIACRRCSNYIFILNLTPGFNGLSEDNCKRIQETFKLWDLVRLILEVLWLYMIDLADTLPLPFTNIKNVQCRLLSVGETPFLSQYEQHIPVCTCITDGLLQLRVVMMPTLSPLAWYQLCRHWQRIRLPWRQAAAPTVTTNLALWQVPIFHIAAVTSTTRRINLLIRRFAEVNQLVSPEVVLQMTSCVHCEAEWRIYASLNTVYIVSDNGLSTDQRQAITRTNVYTFQSDP